MSFWSDVVNDVKLIMLSAAGGESTVLQSQGPQTATTPQQLAAEAPNPAAVVHVIEGIWTQLTNAKMWKSAGWLLLGVALMLGGVLLWIGPGALRRSPAGLAAGAAS